MANDGGGYVSAVGSNNSSPSSTRSREGSSGRMSSQNGEWDPCDDVIEGFPAFLNEFGQHHSVCAICGKDLTARDKKDLHLPLIKMNKLVCIKSVLPDVIIQRGGLSTSYPFCKKCTDGNVSKLTELYKKIQTLYEGFDEVRSSIMEGVIRSFVKFRKGTFNLNSKPEEDEATLIFNFWKRHIDRSNQFTSGDEVWLNDMFEDYSISSSSLVPDRGVDACLDPDCEVKTEQEPVESDDDQSSFYQCFMFQPQEFLKPEGDSDNRRLSNTPTLSMGQQTRSTKSNKNSHIRSTGYGGAEMAKGRKKGTVKNNPQSVTTLKSRDDVENREYVFSRFDNDDDIEVDDDFVKNLFSLGVVKDGRTTSKMNSFVETTQSIQISQNSEGRGNNVPKGKAPSRKKTKSTPQAKSARTYHRHRGSPDVALTESQGSTIDDIITTGADDGPAELSSLSSSFQRREAEPTVNDPSDINDSDANLGDHFFPIFPTLSDDDDDYEPPSKHVKTSRMRKNLKSAKAPRKKRARASAKIGKAKSESAPDPNKKRVRPKVVKAKKTLSKEKKVWTEEQRDKSRHRKKELSQPQMCSICGKVLSCAYNLTVHMRMHNNEKPYICDVCGKAYRKQAALSVHRRSHIKDFKPFHCEICNSHFRYRQVLREHKAKQHKIYDSDAIFECLACSEKFIIYKLLRLHWEKSKCDQKYTVVCTYCSLTFDNNDDLLTHQKESIPHSDAKVLKIREERKEFGEFMKILKAAEIHKCPDCGDTFIDPEQLEIHRAKHDPTTKIYKDHSVTCEICGKSFANRHILKTHRNMHTKEKQYECPTCEAVFSTKQSLIFHQENRHDSPIHICPYCSKSIQKDVKFRRHLCAMHREVFLLDKPWVCRACFLNFEREEELNAHLDAEHQDSICTICGKIYASRRHLRSHQRLKHPSCPLPNDESLLNKDEVEEESDDEVDGCDYPSMPSFRTVGSLNGLKYRQL